MLNLRTLKNRVAMAELRPVEVMCPECRMPIRIPLIVGAIESDGTIAHVNVEPDMRPVEEHICQEPGEWRSARERKPHDD